MATEQQSIRRIRALWQRRGEAYHAIIANASALVGSTAVTSALGFAYWWIAARRYTSDAVGLASAAISIMTLLGTVGMLGLGTLMIGELPQHRGREGGMLLGASIVTAGAGGILGIAFALVAPEVSRDFLPLRMNTATVTLFACGVALTAMTLMLDQALIGMMRGGLQLTRNTLFAAAKIGALVVAALAGIHTSGITIYATWAIGNIISLGFLVAFSVRRGIPLQRIRPDWAFLHAVRGAALEHHGLNLALQFSGLALPFIVTVTLSSRDNAFFYTAWMMAGFVATLPFALTIALYAVGRDDPIALARKIRFTLWIAYVTGIAANIALWFIAPVVLRLFGSTYATLSIGPLRVLALGVFALIIKDHYLAVKRIERRVLATALGIFAASCLELLGAAVGAVLGGLIGLTLGWLVALTIEASLMAPSVLRIAAPFGLRRWKLPTEEEATTIPALASVPPSLPMPTRRP